MVEIIEIRLEHQSKIEVPHNPHMIYVVFSASAGHFPFPEIKIFENFILLPISWPVNPKNMSLH